MQKALQPGATIGILGGGQLGRMLAMAASQLGYRCHIFAPEGDNPAFEVAASYTAAAYDDASAVKAFADDCDVITFEFENIPTGCLDICEAQTPVLPPRRALSVTQDRLAEKQLAQSLDVAIAGFAGVDSVQDLERAFTNLGRPSVLKTRRFGYDGKGQVMIEAGTDLAEAYAAVGNAPCVLEAFVPFAREISVVGARNRDGDFVAYDVPENVHENHILKTSTVPANISQSVANEAVRVAEKIAVGLDYVGVLAVEFFVVEEGGDTRLLMNEIAPRVHNSGHWTMDACVVSQFEQHIRAIGGLELGSVYRHSDVVMENLLGEEGLALAELASEPDVGVHLYGKATARAGRKMGHINRILRAKS